MKWMMKNDEKCFLFHWKLFSFRGYLKFCFYFFGHVGKRLDKKAKLFQSLWRQEPGNKLLQYKYCQISLQAKETRKLHLVSIGNITWETFFLKNHTKNVMEKLVPDPLLKKQNWAHLWINTLKFYSLLLLYAQVKGYWHIYWN